MACWDLPPLPAALLRLSEVRRPVSTDSAPQTCNDLSGQAPTADTAVILVSDHTRKSYTSPASQGG